MINDIYTKGITELLAEGDAAEAQKVGILRGGNSGCILEDGTIVGSCMAETYLRFLGIQTKTVDMNLDLMFGGGRANEDEWMKVLTRGWHGEIKCESDIPTHWKTKNGTSVTGRPDIVLLDKGEKQVGIELKQAMSVNRCYQVLIKNMPDIKHMCQASHYMWQLDVPFELWYANRMMFDIPEWLTYNPGIPKPGEELSEYFNYRYIRLGKINPKTNKPIRHKSTEEEYMARREGCIAVPAKIKPFKRGFLLRFNKEGKVEYTLSEEKDNWQTTVLSREGIERFYEHASTLAETNVMPNEAVNMDLFGKKAGWTYKDYSELKQLAPGNYKGKKLDKWITEVKQFIKDK